MYTRIKIHVRTLFFCLFCILLLVGCGGIQGDTGDLPDITGVPTRTPAVTGPAEARDVGLAYIRTFHEGAGPADDAIWFEEAVTTEDQVGSSSYLYRYESWTVRVTYPVGTTEETIYTVDVAHTDTGFQWQGLVDSYGQVVETAFRAAEPTATPSASPPPTSTPTPTVTSTSTPTATPTQTPSPTPVPIPCNAVEFVTDLTIQDGAAFAPGARFTKVWRLRNVGTCTWGTDYDLVFTGGSRMNANQAQALPGVVRPDESINLSVAMRAPSTPGDYQGLWMLRDDDGNTFGFGRNADQPFWVSISVVDFNEGDYAFDLALDYCSAFWRSDSGRLPCPGFIDSANGFVNLLSSAHLENRRENEPTLWVHPYEERGGWIEGLYPSYRIEEGDHFRAWVGCMNDYRRCDLTFYLDYEDSDGRIFNLGEWSESYDGEVTQIDIDLSDLDGEDVRFILGVEANTRNVEDAQGFWFVPRIE